MSEAIAKLLFVGDIHLGRRPSGPVDRLEEHGLSPAQLGPARAFETTVKLAVEASVDAVVLGGDVIESERDRFEAYTHLERGTRRLVEAGIRVYGVAGNHDAIALPRLAQRIPGFELIGADGAWETRTFRSASGLEVALVGWSFTKNHYSANPFLHPSWKEIEPELRRSPRPVLGVVHGDLDVGESQYAPIRRSDLESAPTDAFFLGHVHQPSSLTVDRPTGYLGSLVGLDPGEHGARGPWLVQVRGRGRVEASMWPVGPLRWERMSVSVDGLEAVTLADELHERLHEAFRVRQSELATELSPHVRAVGCRIELTGRCPNRAALDASITELRARPTVRELSGVFFFLEKLIDRTVAAVELESLAESPGPLGLLARELLHLPSADPETDELCLRLAREIEDVISKNWRGLPGTETRPDPRVLLGRVGHRLLSEMVDGEVER